MGKPCFYCAGKTAATLYAKEKLHSAGLDIENQPGEDVTCLLLDVPSFASDGNLRLGGQLAPLLEQLPDDITIFGGNLPPLPGYTRVDLLEDPLYLAENAYITAECALEVALSRLNRTLRDCPVLIVGWGRIGRCLAKLLGAFGARVTVAARKASHRAICQALGYESADRDFLGPHLDGFRLIFNTVPAPVFTEAQLSRCQNAIKIDLASRRGLLGEDVVVARGLPGIHMPESSGDLIARTCLRLMKEV